MVKLFDAPWLDIADEPGAFPTASAKLLRNRRFRSDYLGYAHPKPQTAMNAPATAKGFIRHQSIEPTSPLNAVAIAEFRRLAKVLDERGVLDRIDLAYLTGAARTKAALDLARE
jgi:hypothetical protein